MKRYRGGLTCAGGESVSLRRCSGNNLASRARADAKSLWWEEV